MKTKKLPKMDSIQKLAKFWDTHDSTDFEDELVEVTEPVFERGRSISVRVQPESITVYVRPDEARAIRQSARAKGVTVVTLISKCIRQAVVGSKPDSPRKRIT